MQTVFTTYLRLALLLISFAYTNITTSQTESTKQDSSFEDSVSLKHIQALKSEISEDIISNNTSLKKDLNTAFVVIVCLIVILFSVCLIILLKIYRKKPATMQASPPIEHSYKKFSIEDKILTYLANNYKNPQLTLADLSSHVGKRSRDISKIIREVKQLTFPQYLSFLRIQEAKHILSTNKFKTISEIGYLVGFNSPSNFNRVFHSLEGISPKKYFNKTHPDQ